MNGNAPKNETQSAYHRRRLTELKTIRNPWETVWRPLAEYIEPTRLRLTSVNESAISRKAILDSTGTKALRTLASGMHSGITSPARPWFRLGTNDPELRDFAPVKEYLANVELEMRRVFQNSGIYTAFHIGYGDLGQFGQSAGLLAESDATTVRLMQLLTGRYWIARDENGIATTLYRQFRWSVQKIVQRFGYERISQISPTIRNNYDCGKYSERYDVYHAVEPRLSRDASKIDKKNKAFLSNYWVDEVTDKVGDTLLEESGFDDNPIIAPPWELAGEDDYALSPGMIALGDIKGLQKETQRKYEALDKIVRPPMTGPTSMRNNPASLLPGAITYADDPSGKGFRPSMEVNLRLGELTADIRDLRDHIRETFYADLFLMLTNMEGIQPRNQFEIAERKEEKLLALGPVLENIYAGQLGPVIDRTYAVMNRMRGLPPPPPDIRGQELKVEYISILAQAQKAVATGAVERTMAFAGNLAAVKPEVLDKIDADEAIDVYSDMLGAPPSIIVPDDKVADIRQQRAQKQAIAENAAVAAQVAPAAKDGAEAAATLSQAATLPAGGSLLQRLGIA